MTTSRPDHSHDCRGCAGDFDRRSFLQRATIAAAAALLALGADRQSAMAEPWVPTRGRRVSLGTVSYPIPAADGAQIDKDNQVILVRWQGSAYAFNLSCPHQNTALRWEPENSRFQCPKHHSKYQPDGAFISGRATRGMDRLGISRNGDQLVVDVDAFYKEDANPAQYRAAVVVLG